jgi:hypothetical protein
MQGKHTNRKPVTTATPASLPSFQSILILRITSNTEHVNNINTRERITQGKTLEKVEIKEEINGTPEYTKSLRKPAGPSDGKICISHRGNAENP